MTTLLVERLIAAPPEAVFAWLTDPKNLTTAPLAVSAHWMSGSDQLEVGAVREVVAVGMWAREVIVAVDAPRRYDYRIIASVPVIDHRRGSVTFTRSNGHTWVRWVSDYRHPLLGGGPAMEAVTSRLLPQSFTAILNACAQALEAN